MGHANAYCDAQGGGQVARGRAALLRIALPGGGQCYRRSVLPPGGQSHRVLCYINRVLASVKKNSSRTAGQAVSQDVYS